MDTKNLKLWADGESDIPVEFDPDSSLSLPRNLLRFRWNNEYTVGVGSDAGAKLRINAVLNGVSSYLAQDKPAAGHLNIVLGMEPSDVDTGKFAEHIGAISTLVRTMQRGPRIRVWSISPGGSPEEILLEPTSFTTGKALEWNSKLMRALEANIAGMAKALVEKVAHPSLALYPKLSSLNSPEPWQVRLDGAEIGRVGDRTLTLELRTKDVSVKGQPREGWLAAELLPREQFDLDRVDVAAKSINKLIGVWSKGRPHGAALNNGHPEHGLEAHILSGRLLLNGTQGLLRLAVAPSDGKLSAAQFPTLWGDVKRPWRYLDALLADENDHPWAIEVKDQHAAGGHGQYLRDGIAQAVLYRHFILSAWELEEWFNANHLERKKCRAALAFPTASSAAGPKIEILRALADLFDVELIEFARPGAAAA